MELLIPHEPNLKSIDSKSYYEQFERAKQHVATFKCSITNFVNDHERILDTFLDLIKENDKLMKIINAEEKQKQIYKIDTKPSSEVLSGSPNCHMKNLSKGSSHSKKSDKSTDKILSPQKENISDYVEVYTADFDSDVEDKSNYVCNSPSKPILHNLIQIQNSPVLSKGKRCSSKKSNSSVSNISITSSNDSKLSLINTPKNLNNSIDNEIDNKNIINDDNKFDRTPLHDIDNTMCNTPKSIIKNVNTSILSVSKTDYASTEIGRGRKLRQTKLSLKKVVPVIDISKDLDDRNKEDKKSNDWKETCFSSEHKKTTVNKKTDNLNGRNEFIKKESSLNDSINQITKKSAINIDISDKEDELIETSPAGVQNEMSKLRNKFSINLKPGMNKIKSKESNTVNSETYVNKKSISNTKPLDCTEDKSKSSDFSNKQFDKRSFSCLSKPTFSKKAENISVKTETGVKRKPVEVHHTTTSDETFFSPVEGTSYKNDSITQYDGDGFEDDLQNKKPVKRMLMTSFDEIPGRNVKSPDFAYKEAPVRKKKERAQLPGWSCRDCEKWYGHLPDEEKRVRQNQCSKHRAKYKATVSTPESFWNPVFDDTTTSFEDD